MEKELFRAIIAENQEYIGRIPLVQRPIDIEEYGNYVFVGVRQAGKSYLLYQRIQQLLANGVEIENIVYINFDDERLQGMSITDFDLILQAYHSMYDSQPIFFFDEIQNVEGWANFARRIANQKYHIYRRTRQTLWSAVQMLTQKLCCQTIHDCPKVVPLHYESE